MEPMEAILMVTSGKASRGSVRITPPTVIGRGRDASLTIGHPMVSRHHCEIFENNGLLLVRDLGSTNGTIIQGRPIEVAPLLPDARFSIGPLTFCVKYAYGGDPTSVPPIRFADEDLDLEGDATEVEPIEETVRYDEEPAHSPPAGSTFEVPPVRNRWSGEVSDAAPAGRAVGSSGFLEWDSPAGDSGSTPAMIEPVAPARTAVEAFAAPTAEPSAEEADDEPAEPEPTPPPNFEEIQRRMAAMTARATAPASPLPPPHSAPPAPVAHRHEEPEPEAARAEEQTEVEPAARKDHAAAIDEDEEIDDFLSGLQ